ncbi:bys1 domain-containing protein [Stagonosporopsis vannaccii]|nr:bys1 domain-containing protein [Stagonosporopsis vannaccii]
MLAIFMLLAMAMQASLAAAIGNAVISNRCPYDIWLWSVDQGYDSGPIHIPARSKYSEPFRSTCNGCGSSLKISKSNQLIGGAHTQFEYSIANAGIWYDISFVDCVKDGDASNCPGHDKGLAMESPEEACGKANCAAGSYCPTQAYYVDLPLQKLGIEEPVFTCPGKGTDMDLYMKVCSDDAPLKIRIAGRVDVDDYA